MSRHLAGPARIARPALLRRPGVRVAGLVVLYAAAAFAFSGPRFGASSGGIRAESPGAWAALGDLVRVERALGRGGLVEATGVAAGAMESGLCAWNAGVLVLGGALCHLGFSPSDVHGWLRVAALAASAMAAHGVGRRIGGTNSAGALAASAFALGPASWRDLAGGGQVLMAMPLFPLAALLAMRVADRPGLGPATRLLLVLLAAGPGGWVHASLVLLVVPFAGLAAVQHWPMTRARAKAIPWLAGAIALGGAWGSLGADPSAELERPLATLLDDSAELARAAALGSGDLPLDPVDADRAIDSVAAARALDAFRPGAFFDPRFGPDAPQGAPGAVSISLGAAGVLAAPIAGMPWALLSAASWLLGRGPVLVDPNGSASLQPFGALAGRAPLLERIDRPVYFAVPMLLGLGALAAQLGAHLATYFGSRSARLVAALSLAVATAAPWAVPGRPALTAPATTGIPAAWRNVEALPPGGLIDLPFHWPSESPADARRSWHAAAVDRKVLGRRPVLDATSLEEIAALRNEVPLARALLSSGGPGEGEGDLASPVDPEDLDVLDRHGWSYVVAHLAGPEEGQGCEPSDDVPELLSSRSVGWLYDVFGRPVVQDPRLLVFSFDDARRRAERAPLRPGRRRFAPIDPWIERAASRHRIHLLASGDDVMQGLPIARISDDQTLAGVSGWFCIVDPGRRSGEPPLAIRFDRKDAEPIVRPIRGLEWGRWRFVHVTAAPWSTVATVVNRGRASVEWLAADLAVEWVPLQVQSAEVAGKAG